MVGGSKFYWLHKELSAARCTGCEDGGRCGYALSCVIGACSLRLDAIAADADLLEKSLSDLEHLAAMLHNGCVEAESHHRERLLMQTESELTGPTLLSCVLYFRMDQIQQSKTKVALIFAHVVIIVSVNVYYRLCV